MENMLPKRVLEDNKTNYQRSVIILMGFLASPSANVDDVYGRIYYSMPELAKKGGVN